jgi:hypothetical protein
METMIRKKKNIKAIKKLSELLPAVLDSFSWYGIGTSTTAKAGPEVTKAKLAAENETEEDDQEDEDQYGAVEYNFDPADVQGAVDEAISTLMTEGLIEEFTDSEDPPSLSDVFVVLFGEDSELTKQAEYFEELIDGYEDRAHTDDLSEAYNVLRSIMNRIVPKSA